MLQEPLSTDGLASEGHDMGADTRTAGGLTDQALEVIHHPDDRFYELLADGQFAGLIVYEDAGGAMSSLILHRRGLPRPGLSQALMRGVLEDVKQRHITVTNYCPVLDRFIEKPWVRSADRLR